MELPRAMLKGKNGCDDIEISVNPFDVGRSQGANFICTGLSVSRSQCRFYLNENNAWAVLDLSSAGTLINGQPVGKYNIAVLKAQDIIEFGENEDKICWEVELQETVATESQSYETAKSLNTKIDDEKPNVIETNCTVATCISTESQSNETTDNLKTKEYKKEQKKVEKRVKENVKELLKTFKATNQKLKLESPIVVDLVEESEEEEVKDVKGEKAESVNIEQAKETVLESFAELMEDELQCGICHEMFVSAMTLNCTHTFCAYCISQWRKKKNLCPLCREEVQTENRALVLDSYIDKVVTKLSEERRRKRQIVIEERQQVAAAEEPNAKKPRFERATNVTADPASESSSSSSSVQFSFSSNSTPESSEEFASNEERQALMYFYSEESESEEASQEIRHDQDYDNRRNRTGGGYYGGYGRCFICQQEGHWAPGCPLKHQ